MIRLAEEKDIEILGEIYNDAIVNSVATFELEKKSPEAMKKWFDAHKGYHALFVYETDGKAVGFASLSQYRPHQAFSASVELSIYVNKEYRGREIGTELMTEIIDFAKKAPEIHTVISVITSENTGSIKLHERFGFRFCGRVEDAGFKFGRYLGIDTFQLIFDQK